MIAKKLILLGLILAGGCMTEQPKWKFSPGTAQRGMEQSVANPKGGVKDATDMSEDIKRQVVDGKINTSEATRIETERRTERARQVQHTLDKIKKEAREEYASSRPYPIKNSILKEQLCLGMDDRDVLVCLGQPDRKTRTVTRQGVRETWAYTKLFVWFEDGVVMGWREEE
jgi:hypothetical protein